MTEALGFVMNSPPRWLQIPARLQLAVACVALPLCVYWWWTYSGLYLSLAMIQHRVIHMCSPMLTFIVTLLLLMIPGTILAKAALNLCGYDCQTSESDEKIEAWLERRQEWLSQNVWYLFGFGLGISLLAAGVGYWWRLKTVDRIAVASLETGVTPGSDYLELDGRLLEEQTIRKFDENADNTFGYIPLVSGQWHKGQPVGVLLKVDSNRRTQVQGPPYFGFVESQDLEGEVRESFEGAGVTFSESPIVLQEDIEAKKMPRWLIGAGIAIALATGMIWDMRRRRYHSYA